MQKCTNDLLHGLFTVSYMAAHSLTGLAKKGVHVKPGLDPQVVEEIMGESPVRSACFIFCKQTGNCATREPGSKMPQLWHQILEWKTHCHVMIYISLDAHT
jgi:hypothetical protein